MVIQRFEIFQVNLDPTIGSEIKKSRPCIVISPDEMNRHIATVIIAPLTSKGKAYPSRVPCAFKGRKRQIVLDQIRTADKVRLVRKIGTVVQKTQEKVLAILAEMFAL